MAHDAFISYSHKDKFAADATCATLERAGIRCWIAPRDIVPGAEWGAAIIDAIEHSAVLVLIFSSNANASRQIRREVERAVSKGVTIVPIRIDRAQPMEALAYFMAGVHWLDALTPPLEKHLQQLAASLNAFLHPSQSPVGREPNGYKHRIEQPPRNPSWLSIIIIALASALFTLTAWHLILLRSVPNQITPSFNSAPNGSPAHPGTRLINPGTPLITGPKSLIGPSPNIGQVPNIRQPANSGERP